MSVSSTRARVGVASSEPDALSIRDGRLFIEELDASDLVERFGSPIFVFSETQLRTNLRRIRAAFADGWPDGPVDVLPAFKANPMLATRHILSEEGAGADIYSPEELDGVLRTGVDPALVSVNGGGKPREHLRRCIEAGVRITVEDVHEIDRIQEIAAELGMTAMIRFRAKSIVPNLWRRTDFSQATVLTLYLLPSLNMKLRPRILDMKPGTRVVTNSFDMGDWDADQSVTVEERTAYLWIVPARVAGV